MIHEMLMPKQAKESPAPPPLPKKPFTVELETPEPKESEEISIMLDLKAATLPAAPAPAPANDPLVPFWNMPVKTCPVCASKFAGEPMLDVEKLLDQTVKVQEIMKRLEIAGAGPIGGLLDPASARFIHACLKTVFR